jgi:hypothetical protein
MTINEFIKQLSDLKVDVLHEDTYRIGHSPSEIKFWLEASDTMQGAVGDVLRVLVKEYE